MGGLRMSFWVFKSFKVSQSLQLQVVSAIHGQSVTLLLHLESQFAYKSWSPLTKLFQSKFVLRNKSLTLDEELQSLPIYGFLDITGCFGVQIFSTSNWPDVFECYLKMFWFYMLWCYKAAAKRLVMTSKKDTMKSHYSFTLACLIPSAWD